MNFTQKIIRLFTYIFVLFLFLALNACKKQEKKEILIEKIAHTDFVNSLKIDGVVEAVRSSAITCPRNMRAKIIFLVEDGTNVKEGDTVCTLENEDLQKQYDDTQLQLESTKARRNINIANLNMKYALLDAQVKSNAAQTAISNLDSLQLKYLSPLKRRIKELELQKSVIEKAKLERRLKSLEIINQSVIRNLDLQVQSLEFRVKSVKDQLDQLSIKSTLSGKAFRARSWISGLKFQEGDQVFGGMPLINIPDFSLMKVIIQASESSYKQININDSVEYSFDAMPGNTAKGKILTKAPVGKPISEKSKVKIFEIEASMDSTLHLPEPGLTTHCNVVMMRIRDTIVVPQIAIFDEDSMKIVYVKKGSTYERHQVKLGATSLEKAVIAAGLTGYEHLSMIKPSSANIKKTVLLPRNVQKKDTKVIKKTKKSSKKPNTQLN